MKIPSMLLLSLSLLMLFIMTPSVLVHASSNHNFDHIRLGHIGQSRQGGHMDLQRYVRMASEWRE